MARNMLVGVIARLSVNMGRKGRKSHRTAAVEFADRRSCSLTNQANAIDPQLLVLRYTRNINGQLFSTTNSDLGGLFFFIFFIYACSLIKTTACRKSQTIYHFSTVFRNVDAF